MCFVSVSEEQVTEWPTNAVGKVGNSVTFNCSGTDMMWYEYITVPLQPQILALKNYVLDSSRYHVTKTPTGTFNLKINVVTLSDAGRYKCQERGNSSVYKIVELIVLGKSR